MNKSILYLTIASTILVACAQEPKNGYDSRKEALEAWINIHYNDASKTPLGVYILENQEGTGKPVGTASDNAFIRVNYTTSNQNGKISSSTLPEVQKQLGNYKPTYTYTPKIWRRTQNSIYVGIAEGIADMNLGGKRKILIPSWLLTTIEKESEAEYIEASKKNTNSENAIYEIEIVDAFNDVKQWEIDSLARYINEKEPRVSVNDSLKYGFYYIKEIAPKDTTAFPNDTTFYINYTGRLLNGQVFDTTIKDTAKVYGIYNESRNYAPTLINWDGEDYTKITMTSSNSTIIDGFAYAISRMRSYEKGTAIFYSDYGYKDQGSGSTIPEYSPLIFEIEIVDKK